MLLNKPVFRGVPKVFPIWNIDPKNVKLTKKRVKWLIKMKKEGEGSSMIARSLRISVRRVNQVWGEYKDTENIPIIGENMGRPPDLPLSEHEKEIIREVKQKYKLGARRLELLIDRDYKMHIPHNKIHKFLLEEGLAHPNTRKQKRRKWVRCSALMNRNLTLQG